MYTLSVHGATPGQPDTVLHRTPLELESVVTAMIPLGMAFRSTATPFPTSAHLSATDITANGDPISEQGVAYYAAVTVVLADHGAGDADSYGAVPSHKLASAAGWHVTRVECAEAVKSYQFSRRHGDGHPADFGGDLIPFLRAAARYDGFHVT